MVDGAVTLPELELMTKLPVVEAELAPKDFVVPTSKTRLTKSVAAGHIAR